MQARTRRSPTGTRLLVEFAADHGIAPETVLAGTSLAAAELADPDITLDHAQEHLAIANVLRRLGDRPGLGAMLGARFSLVRHGDFGFALLTRATARDALALGSRFLAATDALLTVSIRPTPGGATLRLDAAELPVGIAAFATERDLVAICTLVEEVLPHASLRVTVALAADRTAALVDALPGHRVAAGDETCIHFAESLLAQPLPNADVAVTRQLERRLEERLRQARETIAYATRVRSCTVDGLPARRSAEEVAAALHVAPRTLRRRLQDEGTTFQAVRDETLSDLAAEMLRAGLPIAAVADRLGYGDAVAFARAFKRWTDMPPGQWAREAGDSAST